MGQCGGIKIILSGHKHLGFTLQSAECRAVDEPVTIPFEFGSIIIGRSSAICLGIKPGIESVVHSIRLRNYNELPAEFTIDACYQRMV